MVKATKKRIKKPQNNLKKTARRPQRLNRAVNSGKATKKRRKYRSRRTSRKVRKSLNLNQSGGVGFLRKSLTATEVADLLNKDNELINRLNNLSLFTVPSLKDAEFSIKMVNSGVQIIFKKKKNSTDDLLTFNIKITDGPKIRKCVKNEKTYILTLNGEESRVYSIDDLVSKIVTYVGLMEIEKKKETKPTTLKFSHVETDDVGYEYITITLKKKKDIIKSPDDNVHLATDETHDLYILYPYEDEMKTKQVGVQIKDRVSADLERIKIFINDSILIINSGKKVSIPELSDDILLKINVEGIYSSVGTAETAEPQPEQEVGSCGKLATHLLYEMKKKIVWSSETTTAEENIVIFREGVTNNKIVLEYYYRTKTFKYRFDNEEFESLIDKEGEELINKNTLIDILEKKKRQLERKNKVPGSLKSAQLDENELLLKAILNLITSLRKEKIVIRYPIQNIYEQPVV